MIEGKLAAENAEETREFIVEAENNAINSIYTTNSLVFDAGEKIETLPNKKLNLAGVIKESIVDGPGIRFVIFCQGCPHHCPGCHNPMSHSFSDGVWTDLDDIIKAIDKNPLIKGVTFSGGEPVCQSEALLNLAEELKNRDLNIMMYSGYTYEEITTMSQKDTSLRELMRKVDYLVDGRYEEEKRDLTLLFRGSTNQRVLDLNKTRKTGEVTLADFA